jgi:hypothetical protein
MPDMSERTDWTDWHASYDDPESGLSRRLAVIQRHISDWLDEHDGPVTVVSACAGDGRDLLGVLSSRGDSERVTGTLIELDSELAARGQEFCRAHGLSGIEVRCSDAGVSDAYLGAVPADLVLLCGIFGNIDDADVRRLVEVSPQLCRPDATVIWTRHTREPDLTPQLRAWFAASAFDEVDFTAPDDAAFSVGVHRLTGRPQPLLPGETLFRFIR